MENTQQYMDDVCGRLAANGFALSSAVIGGLPVVVGYKSQFRIRWMATKLHLFVHVAPMPQVTVEWLEYVTHAGLDLAQQAKGDFSGMQSGVAVIAALAGPSVDPRAITFAEREIHKKFAAFAWPVAFDTTTQTLYSHKGRPMIGGIYTKWIREQISACLDTRT